MSEGSSVIIHKLGAGDVGAFRALLTMFGEAFGEANTYSGAQPGESYLEGLLSSDHFIALAALQGEKTVGGLAAYELKKFERERSEIYIYDLAVAAAHRRRGIASELITRLKAVARERGAYLIFVQADLTDLPAIALYSKLGASESVLHFDIAVS